MIRVSDDEGGLRWLCVIVYHANVSA